MGNFCFFRKSLSGNPIFWRRNYNLINYGKPNLKVEPPILHFPIHVFIVGIRQYEKISSDFDCDAPWHEFNNAFRDEDNILDQVYGSKYARNLIMMILILYIT